MGLVKYAQNLMIYVNSETILKIDLFSLLIYGRVIHIWDVLFLTITYKTPSNYLVLALL